MIIGVSPVGSDSAMQKFVALSVAEAKIVAGVMDAHEQLYMYRLLESLKLSIESPMILEMDNSWL